MLLRALFVLCASPGVFAFATPVCVLRAFMLASSSIEIAHAVCPFCHGNAGSCTFDSNGACPTKDILGANQEYLAGRTTTGLSLQHVDPEYSGIFRTENLQFIVELLNRPVPGTAFVLEAGTALSKVLTAIRTGMADPRVVMEQWARLAESQSASEAGNRIKDTIYNNMKLLASMKDIVNQVPSRVITSVYDTGVYRWMHAKFSAVVPVRGLDTKAVLQIAGPDGSTSGAASSATHSLASSFIPAKDWEDFMESLNLMFYFCTALGLATGTVFAQYLQDFVYNPMRLRNRSWQCAQFIYWHSLKIIEDSAGAITFANAKFKCNLTHIYEMAERSVEHHYGAAVSCFRTLPRKGGIVDPGTQTRTGAVQWNGEFTPDASQFCPIFQQAGNPPHPANLLSPEGKCLRKHVCFQWVSNKGPRGRCLSTRHGAANCDNQFLCKECVK